MPTSERKKNSADALMRRVVADQEFRKEVVKKSFEFFFPVYLSEYMEYEAAPFHTDMFRILENERHKLAVFVAFRGSAKSTIITTAYVLWSILGIQQKKFIILAGQTEQKARAYLTSIKEQLIHNDLLKKDLGPFEEERNSLGNATAIIIKKLGVKIMICSTEQSIRGARHNQHRPDLIILDDIEDLDSVKTREGRDKTFNWLTGEIIPAGTKKTRIIAVGNLLHDDSVLRRMEKKIDNGELDRLNAVYREYPIVDVKGVPLWPGKYPDQEAVEAEREKTMDEVAWQREYMLRIIATDEQIIKPEYIQFYQNPPANGFRGIFIGVDLAIGQKETNDCTAIVVGYVYGVGKKLKIFIRPHSMNKRLTFPETAEYLKQLVAREKLIHDRVKIYVEDVGYQRAIIQYLDVDKFNIEGVPVTRDKASRLQLTTPLLKDGQVVFAEEGCEELIQQLLGFGKEAHDDLPDAFSMLVMKVVEENPGGGILFG